MLKIMVILIYTTPGLIAVYHVENGLAHVEAVMHLIINENVVQIFNHVRKIAHCIINLLIESFFCNNGPNS